MDLDGAVALVTGASRGIGESVVYELASRGCNVVLMARSSNDTRHRSLAGTIEETAERAHAFGVEVIALRGDVSSEDDVAAARAATLARFGHCDILVNNAAVVYLGTFREQSVKRWRVVLDVNVMGPVLTCQALVPDMVTRGRGRVINLSSAAARMPEPGSPPSMVPLPYAASKAALDRFTVGLGQELQGTGVTANALVVEAVTERHDIPSVTEPPEAPAQVVAWLAEQPDTFTARVLDQAELLPELRAQGLVRPWVSPR
jgi:3-oxoacyl-[acyl-carrier protein] reductase